MAAVLVVDDDPAHRVLVGDLLSSELGLRVVEARDGYEALLRLQEARPDLIVLDLWMPRVDGLGVLRWLGASRRRAPIPVIVLTAVEPCPVLGELKANVAGVVRKPFDLDDLVGLARAALGARPSAAEPRPEGTRPGG